MFNCKWFELDVLVQYAVRSSLRYSREGLLWIAVTGCLNSYVAVIIIVIQSIYITNHKAIMKS